MKIRRAVPVIAVAMIVGAALSSWFWWGVGRADTTTTFNLVGKPLERIAPGTRIGDRAPEGWTFLVFKTYEELASGDVQALPEFAQSLAEFLFSSMVVRVAHDENGGSCRYRLDAVAIGVGTRIGLDDVIITSNTQEKLGAELGPFQRAVLTRVEEHMEKIRQIVASDVMWVVDIRSNMYLEEEHRPVVFRYAFLVHPPTGQLASIVWRIDLGADGTYRQAVSPAVLIKQSLVGRSQLHVDGKKIFAGIPANDAFAATRLPVGAPFAIPQSVLGMAGQQQLTPDTARQLEAGLRQEIVFPKPQE